MAEMSLFEKLENKLKILFHFLLIIFSILLTILMISVALILYLYGLVVWIIVKFYRPDLDSFIVGANVVFVSDRPGKSLSNITMGLVVNGEISSEKLRALFQERVLNLRDSEGKLIYKRLLQTWTYFMGYAFWKIDQPENFNLQNHIRDYDYIGDLHLPRFSDEMDVERIWPKLAEASWREGQSPWEFLVLGNFNKNKLVGENETQTLLIFRMDHIHCDFFSILGLFRALFKSPFSTPKPVRSYKKLRMWDSIMSLLILPRVVNMHLVEMIRGRKLRGRSCTGSSLHSSMTKKIPIEIIKSLKKKYNVEFASVIHSAISGAIARVMRESGQIPPSNIDLFYVAPLPDHPGGWNLHAAMIATELPCKRRSWKERLLETNRILKTYDNSLLTISIMHFLNIFSRTPTTLFQAVNSFLLKFGPSFVMSNVPVTLGGDFVDGMEIVDIFTALTYTRSLGMLITSWGVNNQQRFNFLLDKSIFDDEAKAGKIAKYFENELENLSKQ